MFDVDDPPVLADQAKGNGSWSNGDGPAALADEVSERCMVAP